VSVGLDVELGCPHCGAPRLLDADAVSYVCEHCGSYLVVAHGQREMYVAEETVKGEEDVRRTIILYRVQAVRADIVSRYGRRLDDGTVEAPAESLIQWHMEKVERELLGSLQLVHTRRFLVPYWHLSGHILQAVLGRKRDGPKHVVVRQNSVEHSEPAYDTALFNLRDKGLRLSGSRVRPLGRRQVGELGPYLPWQEVPARVHHEIEKWRTRILDPELEPVSRHGAFVGARRLLVYRAYWIARVAHEQRDEWVLVDGAFGTIAGYPDGVEAGVLAGACVADPRAGEPLHAVVRPSRCPDCGAEQRLRVDARATVCDNCHLLLEPREDGLKVRGYDHATFREVDLDATYLPFWSFRFQLTPQGGKPVSDLAALSRSLLGGTAPPAAGALKGDHLLVPAFRLLGTSPGDAAFLSLAQALHTGGPEGRDGKVPLGGHPCLEDVTVAEAEAREAALFLLYGMHGKASAARLNAIGLRRHLELGRLELQPGRLVYVPFQAAEDALALAGSRAAVPRLLLDGGPELEALRASVHQRTARMGT
jgi:hypothetical protein